MNKNMRFKDKYLISSHRLKGYDYSLNGTYYITICTYEREDYFGEIKDDIMILNKFGKEVKRCWLNIPNHFNNVILDEFIIMPNHIHGIIIINNAREYYKNEKKVNIECTESETKHFLSLQNHGTSKTLGSIIRGFKIGVTKFFKKETPIYKVWQPNYFDKIINNQEQLNKTRQYIKDNPKKWYLDINNSIHIKPITNN